MVNENEKYLTAKEIAGELRDQGITVSTQYIRAMWRHGAPHYGRFGKVSEMLQWWEENPDVKPRARDSITQ